MEPNLDQRWRESFRQHRHDLLNGLQLVSGYLQFGRPERAADALERVVSWMRTLGWIQSATEECGASRWLWAASSAPHVVLQEHPQIQRVCAELDQPLAKAWQWLEESAAVMGWREIGIVLTGQAVKDGAVLKVTIAIAPTDGMSEWWQTTSAPESDKISWTLLNRK